MRMVSFAERTLHSRSHGIFKLVLTAVAVLGVLCAQAEELPIPPPPKVAASSYILMDVASGKILAGKNVNEKLPPASLTKMMTAYIAERELAAGNIKFDQEVMISEKAWQMKGSLMFIEVGERVTVEDLLKGIIIISGNDASVALAEHVAGSEEGFVGLMNSMAKRMGMENTHFKNASGWPDPNLYSTAKDMAILSRHLIVDYSQHYELYSEKEFQYGKNKRTGELLAAQLNRNKLLFTNPNVDGIKTGHSEEAGYCLAASSEQNGRRLIAVVMGADSEGIRARETQKLLTYGFRFFENVDVYHGQIALENVRVWKGGEDEISAGLSRDLVVTVPRGAGNKVSTSMEFIPNLTAPIDEGDTVGSVAVKIGDTTVKKAPLVAMTSVDAGNFFERLWDAIVMFLMNILAGN